MFEALVHVVLRGIVATFVAALAAVGSLVVGFFGGGAGALTIGAFVAFTAFGWALLPAIRHSRVLAVVATGTWLCLGTYVWTLGSPPSHGWLVGPWLMATLSMVLLIALPARGRVPQSAAASGDAPQPLNQVIPGKQAPAGTETPKVPSD